MSGVEISNVWKGFGSTPVLEDVSLNISDGEFITLLGPSGCGKSTLLRILAGLEPQDSGSISIAGRPVDGLRPKARDVAMVFQSYALYPHMTVAANMALPLRMRRLNALQRLPAVGRMMPGTAAADAAIKTEVARTADALGIGHLLTRKPGQLSGGQRQRVAVGRAMVRQPAVFLMDEPLSNLDAKLRVQMRTEIKDLHRRLGTTFIYVTHDQSEAMTMSDRVAVMLEGKILQVTSPRDIYADPDNRRVAEFIGSPKINLVEAKTQGDGLVAAAGALLLLNTGLPAGTALSIGIRPEAFGLEEREGPASIAGIVSAVEHMGSDVFAHLSINGSVEPLIARLPAEHAGHIAPGRRLHLTVRPDQVLMFSADGQRLRPDATVRPLRSVRP